MVRDERVPAPSAPIPRRMNKRISFDGPCTAVDFLSCDSTGGVLETEISIRAAGGLSAHFHRGLGDRSIIRESQARRAYDTRVNNCFAGPDQSVTVCHSVERIYSHYNLFISRLILVKLSHVSISACVSRDHMASWVAAIIIYRLILVKLSHVNICECVSEDRLASCTRHGRPSGVFVEVSML